MPKNTLSKNTPPQPPAIAIHLTGQHLIEASAGTGKTWTLTGIVLRLLIESRRPPEQIICTTFTRAAAAEMRERIQGRLQEFYQLLIWLETKLNDLQEHELLTHLLPEEVNTPVELSDSEKQQQYCCFIQNRETHLHTLAKNTKFSELIADPINMHLIHYILDRIKKFSLNASIRRVQLLLVSMDKLFVGTLDSLAQKWLSEYSSETGHQQGISICDNELELVHDIIHDQIRRFQSHIHSQNSELFSLLADSGYLTKISDHLHSVSLANQFISAPIDEIPSASYVNDFNFIQYKTLIKSFDTIDYEDLTPYFSADYRKKEGMTANASLNKCFESFPDIVRTIQQYGVAFYFHLNKESLKLFDALSFVFLHKDDGGKGFNKTKENNRQTFIALSTIKQFESLINTTNQLLRYIEGLVQRLNRDIALTVRQQLPLMLEEKNKTSFNLQMVKLNQALQGIQGEQLATHIRYHYPIALIDESQDVNGEQAKMIQSIYMSNNKKINEEKKQRHSFLLLVGDPKQAIYGFRGGDVANYNAMKKQFKQVMTLGMNRRSNEKVIESLNQWFDSSEVVYSQLGEDIYYQPIQAHRLESRLSWHNNNNISSIALKHADDKNLKIYGQHAVAILHCSSLLESNEDSLSENITPKDKYSLLAQHIQQLISSDEKIDFRSITPQDIAVLVRSKSDLNKVTQAVEKLGISTIKTIESSVFNAKMAEDILSIMQAIQNPFKTGIVNRALTTSWFGLTLSQIKILQGNHNFSQNTISKKDMPNLEHMKASYHDFQRYLQTAQDQWLNYGLLSALKYMLANSPFLSSKTTTASSTVTSNKQQTSIWQKLAEHKNGQRYLLDLRQLLEILATQTQGMSEQQILDWFVQQRHITVSDEWAKQQPIPSESGVQIMTIHKSKGLEFPIVYVLGMDTSAKRVNRARFDFYPYINENQRRLSPIKEVGNVNFQEVVDKANLGEEKRIAYVALTRASEQVYVVLSDHSRKMNLEYRPANIWLDCFDKNYQPTKRLSNHVSWMNQKDIASSMDVMNQIDRKEPINTKDPIATEKTNPKAPIVYPDYDSIIQRKYFTGWSKTSFTALSRQLDKHSETLATSEPEYAIEALIDQKQALNANIAISSQIHTPVQNSFTDDNIRFTFMRGAGAGTFLHEVLEKMDFNHPNLWSQQIDRSIIRSGLPLFYASDTMQRNKEVMNVKDNQHEQLKQWLSDVLHTKLLASKIRLVDIPTKSLKPELAFDMGLSENFKAEQINELFIKYLAINALDNDKLITLLPKKGRHFYRYLRGEIDLVYEHAGKFYVIDYKSNHLGSHIQDYNQENLTQAMSKAGYWLQALIYQVALHRFLRLRIPNYSGNEEKYLGSVEYMFLRGCVADDSSNELNTDLQNLGKITWDIPINLVLEMDGILGKPQR